MFRKTPLLAFEFKNGCASFQYRSKKRSVRVQPCILSRDVIAELCGDTIQWRQSNEQRREQGRRRPMVHALLGKACNLAVVDELAAPDMLLQYSLHAPRRGHDDIKA